MWRHIVIEGYCFSRDNPRPCEKESVSVFCLEKGHCPYFMYTRSNELEASFFAPLHLIIKEKLRVHLEKLFWKLRWYLWSKWRYNPDWIRRYPVAECPAWDKYLDEAKEKFPAWFEKIRKETKE